jgi:hypothetical protein
MSLAADDLGRNVQEWNGQFEPEHLKGTGQDGKKACAFSPSLFALSPFLPFRLLEVNRP